MTGSKKTGSQNTDPAYKLVLKAIEDLIDRDVDADSPLGKFLHGISVATESYEKELYGPFPEPKAHGQSFSAQAPDIIRKSIDDRA